MLKANLNLYNAGAKLLKNIGTRLKNDAIDLGKAIYNGLERITSTLENTYQTGKRKFGLGHGTVYEVTDYNPAITYFAKKRNNNTARPKSGRKKAKRIKEKRRIRNNQLKQ